MIGLAKTLTVKRLSQRAYATLLGTHEAPAVKAYVRPRPIRIAYLVQENEHWQALLDAIFAESVRRGGADGSRSSFHAKTTLSAPPIFPGSKPTIPTSSIPTSISAMPP